MPPTLVIKPSPVKKQAIIVISWPCKAQWDILNSLEHGCYINCTEEVKSGADTTVALFAFSKMLEFKLKSAPLEASRTKVSYLNCNVQRGEAILTISTEPTFSAVRKVLTVLSKNLYPDRLTPLHKKYMSLLGLKFQPEQFVWAVNHLVDGIGKMNIFVTGAVKVDATKTSTLQDIIKTIRPEKMSGKSTEPQAAKPESPQSEIKCSTKLEAFVVQQFLQSNQIESHVRDANVVPVTALKKFDTPRLKKFVELKLLKLGDKLGDVMLVLCALSGYFDAGELIKLPTKYDAASLEGMLKKHFV